MCCRTKLRSPSVCRICSTTIPALDCLPPDFLQGENTPYMGKPLFSQLSQFLSESETNSKQSKMNTKVVEDRGYIYVSDVFFIKPSLKLLISHSVINFSDKKNTPSRQKKNCPIVLMYHYYTQFLVFTNPIFTKKGNKIEMNLLL